MRFPSRVLPLSLVLTLSACDGPDAASGTAGDSAATTDASGTDSDSSTSTSGSTGGATAPTGTDGNSGSTGGSTFIATTGDTVGEPDCDVWAQDCPAGEKCMPWANDGGGSWNAVKCVPVDANPKQPGDSCTADGGGVSGVDDCDLDAMCWEVDPETNMGTCVAFCEGTSVDDASCADPSKTCIVANDGVLILCLDGCDPLTQDCEGNNVCIGNTSGDGFVCVINAAGDTGFAGDPCEFANVCQPGLFCAGAAVVPDCQGSLGCCAPFCDLANPTCPPEFEAGGAMCTAWFEEGTAPPQYVDVGACVIPQ